MLPIPSSTKSTYLSAYVRNCDDLNGSLIWMERLQKTKEDAFQSLPRKLQLQYLRTRSPLNTSRPSIGNDHLLSHSLMKSKQTIVTFPPCSTSRASSTSTSNSLEDIHSHADDFQTPEEVIAYTIRSVKQDRHKDSESVLHRLKCLRQRMTQVCEEDEKRDALLTPLLMELDIIITSLEEEYAMKGHFDWTPPKPESTGGKDLHLQVEHLKHTLDQHKAELTYYRAAVDDLRVENQQLTQQRDTLTVTLRELKQTLVMASQRLAGMTMDEVDVPRRRVLLQQMKATLDSGGVPNSAFLQVMEQLLTEFQATNEMKSTLESQRDDCLARLTAMRAELVDVDTKFDKLASVYETQWKDLDALTLQMQQMQDDINRYEEVRDGKLLAKNQCRTLETRLSLLLREAQTFMNVISQILTQCNVSIGLARPEPRSLRPTDLGSSVDLLASVSSKSGVFKRVPGHIGDDPGFFCALGHSLKVPVHLRTPDMEPIRNPRPSLEETYKVTRELLKQRPASASDLQETFLALIQHRYGEQCLAYTYAFTDVWQRFAPTCAICWLSRRLLEGSLPEDTHRAMVAEVDHLRTMAASKVVVTEGKVSLSNMLDLLQVVFPNKSIERHLQLRATLVTAADFQPHLPETKYHHLMSPAFGKSPLIDMVRRQFLQEYDEYLFEFQYALRRMDKTLGTSCVITLGDVALAYKMVDPKVPEEEIRQRLLTGIPTALQKEGKKTGRVDFGFKVKVEDYLRRIQRRGVIRRCAPAPSVFRGTSLWSTTQNEPREVEEDDDTDTQWEGDD